MWWPSAANNQPPQALVRRNTRRPGRGACRGRRKCEMTSNSTVKSHVDAADVTNLETSGWHPRPARMLAKVLMLRRQAKSPRNESLKLRCAKRTARGSHALFHRVMLSGGLDHVPPRRVTLVSNCEPGLSSPDTRSLQQRDTETADTLSISRSRGFRCCRRCCRGVVSCGSRAQYSTLDAQWWRIFAAML